MTRTIPRLELDQLKPEVREALAPRVKRLGYLGEFFKCCGHQPRSLLAFMELTEALKEALPDRLTEVVALTVAAVTGNTYERHQHERLSVKLGFGKDWVAEVNRLEPDKAGLGNEERLVQRLTMTALGLFGHGAKADHEAVVEAIGHEQAMAVLMLIGRYVTHTIIVNTLELKPPVPSVFAETAS
jgi:alkylhydroperoxidase family enzyme